MPIEVLASPMGRSLALPARLARWNRGEGTVGLSSNKATTRRHHRNFPPEKGCIRAALKLVPCGDGTKDHLPKGTRVPGSLAKTQIRLPSRAGNSVVVGREKPADVSLGIGTVSAQHAKFEAGEDGEVYVTDMGSSNGTDVDGRPVPRGQMFKLSVGDIVTLGDPHLARYEVVEAGGDSLADRLAGIQETAAEAEKNARAVGEALNKGANTVRNAQAAIAGVGDVFRGFGGKRDEQVAEEVLATIDVDDDDEDEGAGQDDPVEVIQPTYLSDDNDVVDETEAPAAVAPVRKKKFASEERVVFTPVGWSGPAVELEPGVPIKLGTGRKKGDADVILTGVQGVDSSHAVLLRVGGAVYIEDLGSSMGTFVGGRQVRPGLQYELTPGADVQLGDGGCAFTVTCPDDDEGGLDLVPPAIMGGAGAAMVKRAGAESAAVVRNADLSLSKVDDGSDPAASPWGLMGGLKGMGENLGAAIFNSKIQVNYQYKPEIKVGSAGGGAAGLSDLKAALLLALADTERGLRADKERVKKIEQLARALEAKNPTRSPLKSPLMNGRWALQYTTALDVLGKGKPGFMRPKGAIFQTVDIFTLQVKNEESFEPLPFIKFTNASTSDLNAQTDSRASVRPKDYRVAGFKVDAPPSSPGRVARDLEMEATGAGSLAWMDTTFVDGEVRISRSQSGDLFILVRDDPND